MIYQGNARYVVNEVLLHCAAIPTGFFRNHTPAEVFATIGRWHKQRGFAGFGYHGLFMPDGTFYRGRPFEQIGAHCIERNRGSLGFLLIESRKIDEMATFDAYFTQKQAASLRAKIADLHGIERVSGHNDYARKLCPGFKVQSRDWL